MRWLSLHHKKGSAGASGSCNNVGLKGMDLAMEIRDETKERLLKVLSSYADVRRTDLGTSLSSLGLDSIDRLTLLLSIEDEFGITFKYVEEFNLEVTIEDIINIIRKTT